jgi:uncharacterized protein with von Willebrand factor type A (vWA) domain
VKRFSHDSEKFPGWTDAILDLVKEDLAKQDNITRFLVNRAEQPCRSLSEESFWVLATEEEIRKGTRQRFRDYRKCARHKKSSTNACLRRLQDAISNIESSFELPERTNVWKEPSKAEMSMITGLTQSVERLQEILEKFGQRHHANPSLSFIETGGMPQDGIKLELGAISQVKTQTTKLKCP